MHSSDDGSNAARALARCRCRRSARRDARPRAVSCRNARHAHVCHRACRCSCSCHQRQRQASRARFTPRFVSIRPRKFLIRSALDRPPCAVRRLLRQPRVLPAVVPVAAVASARSIDGLGNFALTRIAQPDSPFVCTDALPDDLDLRFGRDRLRLERAAALPLWSAGEFTQYFRTIRS